MICPDCLTENGGLPACFKCKRILREYVETKRRRRRPARQTRARRPVPSVLRPEGQPGALRLQSPPASQPVRTKSIAQALLDELRRLGEEEGELCPPPAACRGHATYKVLALLIREQTSSVTPRLGELRDAGKVMRYGKRRTSSGALADLHHLVEPGTQEAHS